MSYSDYLRGLNDGRNRFKPREETIPVPNSTGVLTTLNHKLGSSSVFALMSADSGIAFDAATGQTSASAPLGYGNSKALKVSETQADGSGYVRAVTLAVSPARPDAPTIVVSAIGNGTIKLAWTDGAANGSPIITRKLWRSLTSGGEVLLGEVTLAGDGTFTDTGLTNGLTYFYKASTVNDIGESDLSLEVSASPVNFDVSVMPDVYPLSSATVSPATNAGDPIFVDMNGAGLQIKSAVAGTPDATKVSVTVQRNGFDTSKGAVTYSETLVGLGVLRNPYPAQGSAVQLESNQYIIVLSDQICATDAITNVTLAAGYLPGSSAVSFSGVNRYDSATYPNPISGILNPPYERIGNAGLRVELAVAHRHARAGQQVAAVEVWVEDSGGNAGPVTTINAMTVSQYTPSTGYVTPRYTPAPVFAGTVSVTGLTNGAGRLHYKVYPFSGPVYSSKTGLQTATWPNLNQPTDGWPVCIDKAGSHAEIYAWVNQDGTAGGSAAVQTGASDPGSAASYATVAAAASAIKAYNNANRGHNDLSGGVIMLRDVTGSAAGANAGSYSTRGIPFSATSTYTPGLTPLKIRAASGVASQLCRWRGIQPDGTVISLANKAVATRVRWEYIYFDSVGLTGTDHIAVDGTAAGLPTTQPTETAHVSQIFVGCIERGSSAQTNPTRYRCGLTFEYGMDSLDPVATGGSGAYNYVSGWAGVVAAIGCKYARSAWSTLAINPRIWLGGYIKNMTLQTMTFANANTPLIRGQMWGAFEAHGAQITANIINIGGAGYWPVQDLWLGQFLARATVPTGTKPPLVRIGADGARVKIDNVLVQYATTAGERVNMCYNDQGYWPVRKSGAVKFSSIYDINNKRDTFPATETPATSNDGTWSASRAYYQGQVLYDGTSTYYQAVQDASAGTALTNTAYWFVCPSGATAWGAQPRRLGAMRYACGVGNRGNAFHQSNNLDASPGPTSWYGEFAWQDTGYNVTLSYTRDTSSTGSPSDSDDGDYTPTGTAQLNKVPSGLAVLPFDLRGTARRNDGTGACGCIERV